MRRNSWLAPKNMKLVLLGSYRRDLLRKNVVLYVCLLFVRVFSVFLFVLSENSLMQNFWLESDKMVKPILPALCSCLVSMIIFLDVFGYVCMPFLIYLVLNS